MGLRFFIFLKNIFIAFLCKIRSNLKNGGAKWRVFYKSEQVA